MAVIRLSKAFDNKIDVYELLNKKSISKIVNYMIDWKYRKSVSLTPWIEKQVKNPSKEILACAEEIKTYDSYDLQVVEVLKYVQRKLTYKGDKIKWNIPEKWSTAHETITERGYYDTPTGKVFYNPWEGDCEDGSILIYVLCRLKGVPANRLAIMCGDVTGGGHAWCVYRPQSMPLNWVFLDWCYWFTSLKVSTRNVFYVQKKIWEYKLIGENYHQLPDSNYKNIWFVFNENFANTTVEYKF